ncbi:MAG: hypothetical protein IPM98_21445 [Lewinellaceae bacterium]|nr:hypothetical protein [Lewinellaceae bacterium]
MENEQLTLIEQYLDGALPPEARAAFEAQVATDSALAAELRLHEAARAAIQVQALLDRNDAFYQRGRQKLKQRAHWWKMLDLLERLFLQRRADGSSRIRWALVAGIGLSAALILILAVRPNWFAPDTATPPPPVAVPREKAIIAFNTHFKRMDLAGTLGGADSDTLYSRARSLYAAGACTDVLPILESLLADEQFESRPMALLLKGTCLLDAGNTDAALETLGQVPPAAAGLYQHAQWYIALTYLKMENTAAAAALLRELAENPRHRHSKEAAAVLGKK